MGNFVSRKESNVKIGSEDKEYWDKLSWIKDTLINHVYKSSYKDDEHLKTEEFKKKQDIYDNTKMKFVYTHTLKPKNVDYEKRTSVTLPRFYDKNCVFKNLRFTSKNVDKLIKYCELVVGGMRIDKIFGDQFKVLRHVYGEKDELTIPINFFIGTNYLPQVTNQDTEIRLEFTDKVEDVDINDFSISIDVYELKDDNVNTYTAYNPFEFKIMQNQDMGTNKIPGSRSTYFLDFYKHVSHILVNSYDNEIDKISLFFNGSLELDMGKMDRYDNYYIIPLAKSLNLDDITNQSMNFSNIDSIRLNVWFKDNKEGLIDIHATSLHGVVINSDKYWFNNYNH
jgi:hypothetical protein